MDRVCELRALHTIWVDATHSDENTYCLTFNSRIAAMDRTVKNLTSVFEPGGTIAIRDLVRRCGGEATGVAGGRETSTSDRLLVVTVFAVRNASLLGTADQHYTSLPFHPLPCRTTAPCLSTPTRRHRHCLPSSQPMLFHQLLRDQMMTPMSSQQPKHRESPRET